MASFILRRLLLLPLIAFGVTLLIFSMLQLLTPYQRLSLYVKDSAIQRYTPEQLDQLITLHGLDKPVFLPFQFGGKDCSGICYCSCTPQYLSWLGNIFLHGNLGWSETDKMPVSKALLSRIPATAELAILAILPLIVVGISMGIVASVNHNKPIDHVTRLLSITGYAFPTFVFGLLVLLIFYGELGWFPPGRLSNWASCVVNNDSFCDASHVASYVNYTGLNILDTLLNGRFDIFLDSLRHLILPVVTLSYVSWALIVRITRSSMLETLRQDYVTVARAKGQREDVVIRRHAARNALIPVATISGLVFAGWLGGVVITETIFNYRGLGKFAADAAISLDIPSVLGFTLLATSLLVIMNLIVDLLYAVIDPRVRMD
ncbi:ABC transporter permease [Candidatus Acetothermia bacterium]|nr:ABC transporter permease [Candidatus Acetothermia bacterium]MBI3643453.1 ABC transporter permease [Candidatus Acetothermia bacterium]